jgi:hypothetical protein
MKKFIPFTWAFLFFMTVDANAGLSTEVPGSEILAKMDGQSPQGPKSASILIPLAIGIFLRLRRPQLAQR